MTEKLAPEAHAAALEDLGRTGWTHDPTRDAIAKTFAFNNFADAFGFMTRTALWAEKWDHHPEWANVYRRVDVTLTTHSAKGLTELDTRLARKMDQLAAS